MLIYILTFSIFLIFSCCEIFLKFDKTTKKLFYNLLLLFLVFQMGLRWETGTDWNNYLENFNNTSTLDEIVLNVLLGFEIGYGFIVLIFKQFSSYYFLFLLLHATVFYFIIFKVFKQYASFPIIAILLFYSSTIGILGSNRQLLAIAICLFSIRYIISKNLKIFILFTFVAFLFHTSAIFFAIAYFLNKDYNKYLIFIFIAFTVIIGFTNIPLNFFNKLGPIFGEAAKLKSDFYLDKGSDSSQSLSIFGLIRRILYFIIFSLSYKSISSKYLYYKLFYNIYTFGLLIYFMFSSSLLILVNRGSLYFNIMECFLLSSFLIYYNKKWQLGIIFLLLFIISIITFYQSISNYSDLFIPYKGLFINSDFSRSMY
jgi:hypothetical protein